jgi:uncharacterized protein YihD (DUF1040 family)
MILRTLAAPAIWAIFVLLFAGCRKNLEEFTFRYTMESTGFYKTIVSFDSNRTYKVESYNYYMDNHAGKQDPNVREGKLSEQEYKTLEKLLSRCNFSKLKDSYGFDGKTDGFMDDLLIYQVHFQTPEERKFISIRSLAEHKYPLAFIELLIYSNDFLDRYSTFPERNKDSLYDEHDIFERSLR